MLLSDFEKHYVGKRTELSDLDKIKDLINDQAKGIYSHAELQGKWIKNILNLYVSKAFV